MASELPCSICIGRLAITIIKSGRCRPSTPCQATPLAQSALRGDSFNLRGGITMCNLRRGNVNSLRALLMGLVLVFALSIGALAGQTVTQFVAADGKALMVTGINENAP